MSKKAYELDLTKTTTEDFIYLAGVVDCGGSFFITKNGGFAINGDPIYSTTLQISSTNESFIDHLCDLFGGSKSSINKIAHDSNVIYKMKFTGGRLTHVCELILPFLRRKRAHCQNMLEMRRTYSLKGNSMQIPPEIIAQRTRCFKNARSLNDRSLNAHNPCS